MEKQDNKEKEQIKAQAKKILENFARALEKVKITEAKVERQEDRRQELIGKNPDPEFRAVMFKNAPNTKDDCIEAERGSWT